MNSISFSLFSLFRIIYTIELKSKISTTMVLELDVSIEYITKKKLRILHKLPLSILCIRTCVSYSSTFCLCSIRCLFVHPIVYWNDLSSIQQD